jgi:hypothetical protein
VSAFIDDMQFLARKDKVLYLREDTRWQGFLLLITADTPAAALLAGFKKSVGRHTRCICRQCYASATDFKGNNVQFGAEIRQRTMETHDQEVNTQQVRFPCTHIGRVGHVTECAFSFTHRI